jgi:hypothetical protein
MHASHPLQEIEVVTGAVLDSVSVRKLRDMTSDMKERFSRDVAYIRERIATMMGAMTTKSAAEFGVLVCWCDEKGRKIGKYGERISGVLLMLLRRCVLRRLRDSMVVNCRFCELVFSG